MVELFGGASLIPETAKAVAASPVRRPRTAQPNSPRALTDKIRMSRVLGVSGAGLGISAGAWMAHPAFGALVTGMELLMGMVILFAALFGSESVVGRTFRLLRWIADRPEPPERRSR
ncbi:hypothetical protein [Streptosporangium sp. NPDC000396]|uniref:hypothetical protein n=1 Tax=Streptosporangium sp. NPDC000396 TaxID=3366185 RepID=UPI003678DBAF